MNMEGLRRFRPAGSMKALQLVEEIFMEKVTGTSTYKWPSITLIFRKSVLGLRGRPFSRTVNLNGSPLLTTKVLEPLKSSVLCLARFSEYSRLTF